jgi:hypothetical protein
LARKIGTSAYLLNLTIGEARQERISEADLMTGNNPLSFLRRIEWQWVERIKSPRQVRDQIVVATEPMLQSMFSERSLIPVPIRTAVDRRRRPYER